MSVSGVPHVRAVAHAAAGSAGDEPEVPPLLGGPTGITPPPGEADSVTPPPGTQPAQTEGSSEAPGTDTPGTDTTAPGEPNDPLPGRGKRPPRTDDSLAPTVAPIENAGAGVEWVSGAVIAAILTGLGIGPVDDAVGGAELEVDPGKRPPK